MINHTMARQLIMGRILQTLGMALPLLASMVVSAADAFTVTARLERVQAAWQVVVELYVPPQHDIFADQRFKVQLDGLTVTPVRQTPAPALRTGPDGQSELVWTTPFTAVYALATGRAPVAVDVRYQGCSDTLCFPPRTRSFLLKPDGTSGGGAGTTAAPPVAPEADWPGDVAVRQTAAGYLGRDEFLAFLARAQGRAEPLPPTRLQQFARDPQRFLREQGLGWTLFLMLLGGLLLNLTPCVLPMIPVNLAIIGAGVRAGSRTRGLLLGLAYGGGIAAVYGALGSVVILTGTVFGALQSSPLFNGVLAVLFVVLALAMFDLLPVDLSRFQPRTNSGGGFWAAAVAGGVSALLAGACVAPVVAAVLLLAGSLYHDGVKAALLLPFLLGVGMALPWPLAGAGLTVLPKPGAWMRVVKSGFALLILALALYYGWLAWQGVALRAGAGAGGANELVAGDREGWQRYVAEARRQNKPIFLDFHASWCKNCHTMDRTTFRDPAVRQALQGFLVVRVATERPGEDPAQAMVRAFGVSGLPYYVVVDAR